MVTIATFNEPSQAKHLKSRLQETGVKADIHNEGRLQKVAFMSKPQANAKVLVTEKDFEEANGRMGGERSGNRHRHPVSAMQVAPGRISAIDAEVSHSVARQHSFRTQDFPKRILLPGLPLHVGEG